MDRQGVRGPRVKDGCISTETRMIMKNKMESMYSEAVEA
jgi:hypothetical protein